MLSVHIIFNHHTTNYENQTACAMMWTLTHRQHRNLPPFLPAIQKGHEDYTTTTAVRSSYKIKKNKNKNKKNQKQQVASVWSEDAELAWSRT